ncbi:VOC family protein [Leptolyngbya sp. FACHB-671]|uniref:VOC family protein n=1 Tax=Leptolyngbya sp. FACHB-671 TaxID=2692812 RepID=UPI001687A28A|nr:VOC family protein [Leptolyngbya sp. FACHB-671]MBD2067110.1 VOC family protein [Leptolyngbya sp. FACHB-671]
MKFECSAAFVTLATTRLEDLVKFYAQLFGQLPQPHLPNRYAEFQLPGLRLGIFQPKQENEAEFAGERGKISLCLEVKSLEEAIAHLTALGYSPPGEVAIASHGKEIYAYDPDQNRLILHQS